MSRKESTEIKVSGKKKTTRANDAELTLPKEVNWPSPQAVGKLQRAVLKWYQENARDLPWRLQPTPYRIWVSEIMLQQTQVATVIDYWNRFLHRFPDVVSLGKAKQEEVLKLWEGLGYYRRARQLHAAAQQVVEQHDGRFPTDFEQVLSLPGIGRYTAGAILSISLDQPYPILEGNTIRLFARLLGLETDPTQTINQKLLWRFAETLVPAKEAGHFNQGLMEIGGRVCRLADPECPSCPLRKVCRTFETGQQKQIPAPKAKPTQYQSMHECLVLIQRNGKFLCRQSTEDERWTGLWDFVRIDITELVKTSQDAGFPGNAASQQLQWLQTEVKKRTGLSTNLQSCGWQVRHAVTRYRIQLNAVESSHVQGRIKPGSGYQWCSAGQLQEWAFNVTARKFISQHLQPLD